MKQWKYVLSAVLVAVSGTALAQKGVLSYQQRLKNRAVYDKILSAYSDSLARTVARYEADTLWRYRRTRVNPLYYRLFVPVTVYRSVVANALDGGQDATRPEGLQLLPRKGSLETDERINASIDAALLSVYLNDPFAVRYGEDEVLGKQVFQKDVEKKLPRSERVVDLLGEEKIKGVEGDADLLVKKPNFWTKSGKSYLQFTQNYVSSNWYKGGESNNALLSGLAVEANYNDQQKIQWDNKFELKLGFLSSRSDTLHKYKTNTDLLRLTSKLGLRAVKNLYYTVQAEFYTQLFPTYNSNNPNVISSFLSPGYLKFDLGMDYKRSTKTFTVSSVVAPLSYKMTYVQNKKVDETKFSIDEGKKMRNDFGSNIQVISAWKIISQVEWESRISYFTTYEKAQAEWENTFNFSLNRYLATKLFVHARFDDGVPRREGKNYFQLMELLSFGLTYNW